MKNNYGKYAEKLAVFYLFCKGYKIIARNQITGRGTSAGEIDIIASKGKFLVFIEVKKRQSLEKAAYAISAKQKKRIFRGAEAFLGKNPAYRSCDIRFDAVLIKFPFFIAHIQNAWEENL